MLQAAIDMMINCAKPVFSLCLPSLIQCFFPQNIIAGIRTPLFLVNAAYDSWQVNFPVLRTL